MMTQTTVDVLKSHPGLQSSPNSTESSLEAARQAAQALPHAFEGVDVLLIPGPPPKIAQLSQSYPSAGVDVSGAAEPLADIIRRARPRYMFWADSQGFWEREPFGWNHEGKDERWTRAVKLGALGDQGEKKGRVCGLLPDCERDTHAHNEQWFYAFTLPPQAATSPLPVKPANATPNPYTVAAGSERKRPALEDQQSAFAGPDAKRSKNGERRP